jgi:uncharacterized protein (TIGR02302 family)
MLAFERIWPALLPAAIVVALFLILSWFGAWLILPVVPRIVLLVLFAGALIATIWPMLRIRLPDRVDGRARIEQSSSLPHRPLTALEDRLAGADADETTRRLWETHRKRVLSDIGRLSAGLPKPGVAARDPFALRAAVLLLLVIAFAWAGPDRQGRILSAFAPIERYEAEMARIDAWVMPPAYTGRPPLLLTGNAYTRAETGETPTSSADRIRVAQGSTLVVRIPRDADAEILHGDGNNGDGAALQAVNEGTQATTAEYLLDLEADNSVTIRLGRTNAFEWSFAVIPDVPPSISFSRAPDLAVSRALRLHYEVADDYGVVRADARFVPLDDELAAIPDPLVAPPDFRLTLPQMRARSGAAQTIRDLTAHPWAGAAVRIHLTARDDLGQEGVSDPVEFTLPQRSFREPLARALVEQRRNLAIDRDARDRVALALDALSQAPERHIGDVGVYLGLRSSYWRLRHARNDDTLLSVIDQLWEIALSVEDGELSLAAEDLRAAQERLMDALAEGASDEELERLMTDLRQALDRFMQEMARRALSDEDMAQMPLDPDARTLSQSDLDQMLDAIENIARGGAREQAMEMLSQLRNMLENLQAGRPPEGMQSGPMGEMLDELGEMIRRQQELMDQTFELDRNAGEGQADDPGRLGELGEGQGALREALEALMERLSELGADPGAELGQAGEAMGEAEGALGGGETGEALGQQGRALENLRRGGQSLAEQMMQQGEGFAAGQPGQARQRTDPFGRPLRTEGPDHGLTVEVPDEIDTQRARQILEELRRRLSDPTRPRVERDYLERLLDRF